MELNHTNELRALTAEELESVAGGRKIDIFRNQRALELVAATEKWLASIGAEGLGFGQLR